MPPYPPRRAARPCVAAPGTSMSRCADTPRRSRARGRDRHRERQVELELGIAEVVRDLLSELRRPPRQERVVLGDLVRDLPVEPGFELVPHPRRVGLVDRVLGLAEDLAGSHAQVVVDVRVEIRDAVAERHLPSRGVAAELVGARLGRLELADHRRDLFGIVERGALGAEHLVELFGDREHVVGRGPNLELRGVGDDPVGQVRDELGEPGLDREVRGARRRGERSAASTRRAARRPRAPLPAGGRGRPASSAAIRNRSRSWSAP